MRERILVPVDGSERSKDGLEYALERFPEADMTALYVKPAETLGDLGLFSGSVGKIGENEEVDEFAETVLEDASQTAADHGVTVETVTVRGEPERAIVAYADNEAFDLIVIGSHGREGAARILLGSVADKVVRRSPTPVLVVR